MRSALYFRPALNDLQDEQRSQGTVRSHEGYMFPMQLDSLSDYQFGR
jgi:hypothetical protein